MHVLIDWLKVFFIVMIVAALLTGGMAVTMAVTASVGVTVTAIVAVAVSVIMGAPRTMRMAVTVSLTWTTVTVTVSLTWTTMAVPMPAVIITARIVEGSQ
jgi:hypothetical protein